MFKVFYESVHNRIKGKIKLLDSETQAVIANQNSPLNEKIYQKNLRDYLKSLIEYVKSRAFKSASEEQRYYIHMYRVLDCLNL